MKIAILTLPLHTNYGGILQAYALQTVLERLGHQTNVLQNTALYSHNTLFMPLIFIKRVVANLFYKASKPVFIEKARAKENAILQRSTNKFISQHINLKRISRLYKLSSTEYNAIVVGSDQIWRKHYFCGLWFAPIKDAFLDFTKDWDIKRIAYAASFGLDNFEEYSQREITDCRNATERFDGISVRESSALELVEKYFNYKATHVLDPTMLLEKEDYVQLVDNSSCELKDSEGELFTYILDNSPKILEIIDSCATNTGLKRFNCYASNFCQLENDENTKNKVVPPVEQWIRSFIDAKMIVTDSFHGTVFSIIFNKPFWVVANHSRGADRFSSLLKLFRLEDRIITDHCQNNWDRPIDWEMVNSIRIRYVSLSKSFLTMHLQ